MKYLLKKSISIFLIAILFLSSTELSLYSYATTYVGKCGKETSWNLDTRYGKLTVSGKGKMTDYESLVKTPWYNYRESINEIEIDYGVTKVGSHCFDGLPNVNLVIISTTVLTLGDYSFSACPKLKKVQFSDYSKLKIIGDYCFAYCRNLYDIEIPDKVKTIKECAFLYCYSIESLSLPYSVEKIGKGAFSCCANMKKIEIINYNCDIYDEGTTIYEDVKIISFSKSTGRDYAEKYLRKYSKLKRLTYLNDLKIKLSYTKTVYSGKKKTPTVTVSGLKKGKDFTVSYINNINVGTAKVIISSAGDIYGEVIKEFKIVTASPKKLKSKSVKTNSLTLTWQKVKKAKGYIVYQVQNGKLKKLCIVKTNSAKLSDLTKNHKYQFCVKSYFSENNKRVLSTRSSIISVRTLKSTKTSKKTNNA